MSSKIIQIVPGTTNAIDAATQINEALRETGGGLTLDGNLTAAGSGSFGKLLTVNGGTGDGDSFNAELKLNRISSTGNVLASRFVLDDIGTNYADLKIKVKTTVSAGEAESYYKDAIIARSQNALVELNFNGVKKFETISTGTKTTGNHEVSGSGNFGGAVTATGTSKFYGDITIAQSSGAETAGYFITLNSHYADNTGYLAFAGNGGAGKVIGGASYGASTNLYANDAVVANLTTTLATFNINTKITGVIEVTGSGSFGGSLNIANVPTSATGLVSGDIWSNNGVLNIVA